MTAKAAPDGYTLLLSTAEQVVINPHITRLSYDPLQDLAPVVYLTGSSLLLVTHPSVPVPSVKALVALARAHPGRLNHGSGGSGSPAHLAMELFKYLTGAKMTHVPFKGVGPAAMRADIVSKIHADVTRLLGAAEVRDRLIAEGGEPGNLTVEQFAAFIRAEHAKWGKVIRAAGIKGE